MNADLLNCLESYRFMNIKINKKNSKSELNEKVKQIYVINLYEDIFKRNYIYELFKKYNISSYNLIIVDRVDKAVYNKLCNDKKISESELGCCLSHMWCLLDIIKNNYENAIIFEDDVILSKTFIESFLSIYKKNPKLDFLMLGAHDYNFSREHFKNVKNSLYRPNSNCRQLYGAHANFYSLNGAKKMFYIRATNLSFFDNEYNLLFDSLPNSYICYPNLAIANISESKINHEKDFLSKAEIGYYSLCFYNINLNDYNVLYINVLDLKMLKNDDTLESFVDRCLLFKFNDINKANIIKQRFALDFFTIKDVKQILSNQSLIDPNNLSKKCIGENS
jgi:GR25 family glycosyltransferase involved in LPS biosynthesis